MASEVFLGALAVSIIPVSLSPVANSEPVSPWRSTISYPLDVYKHSCVFDSFSIYSICVGGDAGGEPIGWGFYKPILTNSVYYAQTTGTIASWSQAPSYPINVDQESCVVNCVGGETTPCGNFGCPYTSAAYYAKIGGSGVVSWTPTTSYPTATEGLSCVAYSGYIYCIGGVKDGSGYTNAVYLAPLSSNGIGAWSASQVYPITVTAASCVVNSGYIYCVGGKTALGALSTSVFFASISGSNHALGSWTETTSYPVGIGDHSCVVSSGYVYCIGGYNSAGVSKVVYYSQVSSVGVGAWSQTTDYPVVVEGQSCFAQYDTYIDCVAGYIGGNVPYGTDAVFYWKITPPTVTTTQKLTVTNNASTAIRSLFTSALTTTTPQITTTNTQAAATSTATSSAAALPITATVTQLASTITSTTTITQSASADVSSAAIPVGVGIAAAGAVISLALRRRH